MTLQELKNKVPRTPGTLCMCEPAMGIPAVINGAIIYRIFTRTCVRFMFVYMCVHVYSSSLVPRGLPRTREEKKELQIIFLRVQGRPGYEASIPQ